MAKTFDDILKELSSEDRAVVQAHVLEKYKEGMSDQADADYMMSLDRSALLKQEFRERTRKWLERQINAAVHFYNRDTILGEFESWFEREFNKKE